MRGSVTVSRLFAPRTALRFWLLVAVSGSFAATSEIPDIFSRGQQYFTTATTNYILVAARIKQLQKVKNACIRITGSSHRETRLLPTSSLIAFYLDSDLFNHLCMISQFYSNYIPVYWKSRHVFIQEVFSLNQLSDIMFHNSKLWVWFVHL